MMFGRGGSYSFGGGMRGRGGARGRGGGFGGMAILNHHGHSHRPNNNMMNRGYRGMSFDERKPPSSLMGRPFFDHPQMGHGPDHPPMGGHGPDHPPMGGHGPNGIQRGMRRGMRGDPLPPPGPLHMNRMGPGPGHPGGPPMGPRGRGMMRGRGMRGGPMMGPGPMGPPPFQGGPPPFHHDQGGPMGMGRPPFHPAMMGGPMMRGGRGMMRGPRGHGMMARGIRKTIGTVGKDKQVKVKQPPNPTKPKTKSKKNAQNELNKPWISEAMKNEIMKKHKLHQKAKKSRSKEDWESFKEQRNKVTTMIREARIEYIGAHPEEDVDKIMAEACKEGNNASNGEVTVESSAQVSAEGSDQVSADASEGNTVGEKVVEEDEEMAALADVGETVQMDDVIANGHQ